MASQSLNLNFESAYELYTGKVQKVLEKVTCLRCGRPLTNEKSRQARLGPKCARKLAYETRTRSFSAKTLKCHNTVQLFSSQVENIPTQDISLYSSAGSSQKPYCKIGTVTLPATDSYANNKYVYPKRLYTLLLLEGLIYEIFEPIPKPRTFQLQVHNHKLKDISISF